MLKFCVGPRGDVLTSTYSHADAIGAGRKYDAYVRAIYFPEKRAVYFRYAGDYDAPESDEERGKAFRRAENALDILIEGKYVPKRARVLFWETGHGITERDIKL